MYESVASWPTDTDLYGGLSLYEETVLDMKLKKKRNKLGQQIDRYWNIRDVQRALKVAGLLTDPKSKMKEAKKLLDETQ